MFRYFFFLLFLCAPLVNAATMPLSVSVVDRLDTTDPAPLLRVRNATTTLQSVPALLIVGDTKQTILISSSGEYRMSALPPGTHTITLVLSDERRATTSVHVTPLSTPSITVGSPRVVQGELIEVQGSGAPPHSRIRIQAKGPRTFVFEGSADGVGTFNLSHAHVYKPGVYELSAIVIDSRLAQSDVFAIGSITLSESPLGTHIRDILLAICVGILTYRGVIRALRFLRNPAVHHVSLGGHTEKVLITPPLQTTTQSPLPTANVPGDYESEQTQDSTSMDTPPLVSSTQSEVRASVVAVEKKLHDANVKLAEAAILEETAPVQPREPVTIKILQLD